MKENSIEEETISSNHDSPLKKVLYSENIFNHLKDEKNNEKPNKLSKSYKINISKDTINKENEDMKYNFGIFPDKKDLDSPQNKIKEKENSSPNEFKEFKFTLLKMIDDDIKNNFQNKSLLNQLLFNKNIKEQIPLNKNIVEDDDNINDNEFTKKIKHLTYEKKVLEKFLKKKISFVKYCSRKTYEKERDKEIRNFTIVMGILILLVFFIYFIFHKIF
jgi:hypothetical protein